MVTNRTKPKLSREIHQIFGINGVLAVLSNKKYHVQIIEILEKSHVARNTEVQELLKNYISQRIQMYTM